MFDKMKALMDMQKKMQEMKRELAIKRSHDIAASKMKDITGLNFPGLL